MTEITERHQVACDIADLAGMGNLMTVGRRKPFIEAVESKLAELEAAPSATTARLEDAVRKAIGEYTDQFIPPRGYFFGRNHLPDCPCNECKGDVDIFLAAVQPMVDRLSDSVSNLEDALKYADDDKAKLRTDNAALRQRVEKLEEQTKPQTVGDSQTWGHCGGCGRILGEDQRCVCPGHREAMNE